LRATFLLLVGFMGVVGCGDNRAKTQTGADRSAGTTTTKPGRVQVRDTGAEGSTEETTALARAVRAYSDAYLGDAPGSAYELLSQRCKQRITPDEMRVLTAGAKELYGIRTITDLRVEELSGNLARVTYRYKTQPEIDQVSEPWVKEAGGWHQDDC
jgi:hypothetical protein